MKKKKKRISNVVHNFDIFGRETVDSPQIECLKSRTQPNDVTAQPFFIFSPLTTQLAAAKQLRALRRETRLVEHPTLLLGQTSACPISHHSLRRSPDASVNNAPRTAAASAACDSGRLASISRLLRPPLKQRPVSCRLQTPSATPRVPWLCRPASPDG